VGTLPFQESPGQFGKASRVAKVSCRDKRAPLSTLPISGVESRGGGHCLAWAKSTSLFCFFN
jgi:hypothetical protein